MYKYGGKGHIVTYMYFDLKYTIKYIFTIVYSPKIVIKLFI